MTCFLCYNAYMNRQSKLSILLATIHFGLSWLGIFSFDELYFAIPVIFGVLLAVKENGVSPVVLKNVLFSSVIYSVFASFLVELNIYGAGAPFNISDFIASCVLLIALSFIGGMFSILLNGLFSNRK